MSDHRSKIAFCKGSWAIGSACGQCAQCHETLPHALAAIKAAYAHLPDGQAICHDLERAFALGYEFGIERAAGVVDQCNHAHPVNAQRDDI
jgi:hypothetical protein